MAQRLVGSAILLVLVILAGMLFMRSFDEQSLPELIEKLPENVDLGLNKIHYSQNEDGIESWVLDADRATYQRKDEELALTDVMLTFFSAGRFGDVNLNASAGILQQKLKVIDLQGSVRIVTSSGEQFQSETLRYDYAAKRVTTDDFFSMQSPQLKVTGKGMVLDLIQGSFMVHEDVHAYFEELKSEGEQQ
jgi:LPS export ABC transporter protein LptC